MTKIKYKLPKVGDFTLATAPIVLIKGDVTDLQKRVQYLEQIILNLPKPEPKKRSFWNRWTWL